MLMQTNRWRKQLIKKQSSLLFSALFLLTLFLSFPVAAVDTITPISTDGTGAWHTNPAIYGDRIVWSDDRTGTGFFAVYLYNLTTGIENRISYHDGSNQLYPVIFGDLIAYADDRNAGNSDIYLYNIRTGQTDQVTNDPADQTSPAIFGNRIVWMDSRNGGTYNIYVNGTSPGTETALSPNLTYTQRFPAISGDLVIWLDNRNGDENIIMFNLTSGMETPITDFPSTKDYPALYGNRVVWQDSRNGFWEIFINGTSPGSEQSITPNNSSDHQYPSIYGTKVVWGQNAEGIYLNDTAMSPASIVPVETLPGTNPSSIRISVDPVYGNRVVWVEESAGREIYLSSSGGSGTCPVAEFTNDFSSGSAPVAVHFTDNSTAGATHWFWDFGDGSNSTLKNPAHTYLQNSSYDVILTVGNPTCRNANKKTNNVVVGRPIADFIASPTSDIAPAAITFTDMSSGTPTSWLWDFGDLSPASTEQNPVHTYTAAGTYNISLTATNAHGTYTKTRTGYISILNPNGVNKIANTTIAGLTITHCGAPQSVTVDAKILPSALIPNSSVLEIQPPSDRGFRNITLYALDGIGFTRVNNTITGNITGVHLETEEFIPGGFSNDVGSHASVHYAVDLSSYPCNARLTTKIWEGAIPDDQSKFQTIALGSNFAHYLGTAYTTKITKTNFPPGATAKFHMSVNASWVASIADGRNQTFIQRISDDASIGEVLQTRYLFHDSVNNLDYFEADSPRGLSTFGLSLLSGSGNPIQLITLTVASHIGSGGGGGGSSGGSTPVVVQNTVLPEIKPLTLPDPGKTDKIYANLQGVISQATTLRSTDGLATVTISEGIVAKDTIGKALSSITIKAIPADSIPAIPAGSAYAFSGMAYDLQPESATFSPAISISYTVPQARWGQEFLVKTFDTTTGSWQDVPTRYNPNTGLVTAEVSHFCCFALFTKTVPASPTITSQPAQLPAKVAAPPPPTAMSTFSGMILWIIDMVTKNVLVVAGILILAVALFLYGRKRRRDRVIYLF